MAIWSQTGFATATWRYVAQRGKELQLLALRQTRDARHVLVAYREDLVVRRQQAIGETCDDGLPQEIRRRARHQGPARQD